MYADVGCIYAVVGCIYMERLGAKCADVGCISMKRLGAKYADVGCKSMERLGACLTVLALPGNGPLLAGLSLACLTTVLCLPDCR